MDTCWIKKNKLVYFCEKTGQISETKEDWMIEVESKKPYNKMCAKDFRELIADTIAKLLNK